MLEDKAISKDFIKDPYILIMGIDKYESRVSSYITGTLVDIARVQKWLSDEKTYNYKTINVMKTDEKGHINAAAVRQWLHDARLAIETSWHPNFNRGKPGFDGLILYLSCHGGFNSYFKFLNLFFGC